MAPSETEDAGLQCEKLREDCKKLRDELKKLERRYHRLESDYKRVGIMYKTAERLRDFNEAEKDLQYFYNRLLLKACADTIFVLDREMRIVLATDVFMNFLGFSDIGDVVNHSIKSLFAGRFSPEVIERFCGRCDAVLKTSLPQNYTQRVQFANGEELAGGGPEAPGR